MNKLIASGSFKSQKISKLRSRLDHFYSYSGEYTAFQNSSVQTISWDHIANSIFSRLKAGISGKIRILEIGAGKSGLGNYLLERGLRHNVHWITQDITEYNLEHLVCSSDESIFKPIEHIEEDTKFDIIFSTYCLEHVSNPEEHLNAAYELLNEGGEIFIFCPRYDLMGYIPPSFDHVNGIKRFALILEIIYSRIKTLLTRKSAFLIWTDPAIFQMKFSQDRDAIHLVSQRDLFLWAQLKNLQYRKLVYGSPKLFSRDWLVKRYLTIAVCFTRVTRH